LICERCIEDAPELSVPGKGKGKGGREKNYWNMRNRQIMRGCEGYGICDIDAMEGKH
jgi:hypothetical protein